MYIPEDTPNIGRSTVHLHVHSHYSFGLGASAPEELARAASGRFRALALTDTNGVYGAVRFQQACDQHGVRPILGAHLVTRDHGAVVLAEDDAGWGTICRAITQIHWDPTVFLPDLLARDRRGIAVLSASRDLLTRVAASSGTAGLHAELRPEPAAAGVLATARRLGLPPVLSGAVVAAAAGDWPRHRLLRAIHDNRSLSRVRGLRPRDAWLRPVEALLPRIPDAAEALRHAEALAERCRYRIPMDRTIAPRVRDTGDALLRLRTLAEQGIAVRYAGADAALRSRVTDRLHHELAIIAVKQFADYFLIVHEIAEKFPVHCGRGSVANSLIAYALGITNVEPLGPDLLFERFLNPDRRDPPDIDLDFPWDERDRIFAWIFRKYPRPQAAMVANHSTLQIAGALREVAKVLGRPATEIRDVTRRVPYYSRGPIRDIIRDHPNFRDCHLPRIWEEIADAAESLVDTPRHLSLHPGGVVIVPGALTDYVPLERAAKVLDVAPDLPVPVIQFEKDAAEDIGLIKIDILGNRSLAVIRDARAMVHDHTGRVIDLTSQEAGRDPATQALFRTGTTVGVFYTESPASRIVNTQSQADDFETLVLNTSIIRPASNKWIRIYLERHHYRKAHGSDCFEPVDPSVRATLHRSYGIMVYQEDVVNVAHAFAGFTWADADGLRKALSKKRAGPLLASYRRQFVAAARARGRPEEATDRLWEMILSFAGYSFCKGHSCSYIQVAQQSGWLRANHPAEFFAAVLSNEGGFYRAFAYVAEAQRDGLTVHPPDINQSRWSWTGRGRDLLTGFQMIRGISRATIDRLLQARAAGAFASLADLRARVAMRDDECRLLIKVGALDAVGGGLNRPQLLWQLDSTAAAPDDALVPAAAQRMPALRDYDAERKRYEAWRLLGFCVDRHPMTLHHEALRPFRLTWQRDLGGAVGRRVLMAGMYITGKPVATVHNEPMQFATFDDGTGLVECVLFPAIYRRYGHLLFDQGPFLFRGEVAEEFGVRTVMVSEIDRLDRVLARRQGRVAPAPRGAQGDPATTRKLSSQSWT